MKAGEAVIKHINNLTTSGKRAFYLASLIPQTPSAESDQISTHMHFPTIACHALEGCPNKVLSDADQIAAELTKATRALEALRRGEKEYLK